uniref:Chromosome 5 open reading frame 54 n=1 Tax=Nothobranchius furzeri TaxID=105023 RepID=A0A1A8ABM8_NOTFU
MVRAVSDSVLAETDAVFRTAYYTAKMNRPFTDHDNLIELQERNGVYLGTSLHSWYSCTKIVEHVAKEMQAKIVNSIVSSSSKLSVLIDEATSASHKSAMIVSVKASIDGETPEFLFLELVELESQTAESIEKT